MPNILSAFDYGFDAKMANEDFTANPYPFMSAQAEEWDNGYWEAADWIKEA